MSLTILKKSVDLADYSKWDTEGLKMLHSSTGVGEWSLVQ